MVTFKTHSEWGPCSYKKEKTTQRWTSVVGIYLIDLDTIYTSLYLVNRFPRGNLVESVSLDFFCPFLAFQSGYHALAGRAREIGLVSHKQHDRWYLSTSSRVRHQESGQRWRKRLIFIHLQVEQIMNVVSVVYLWVLVDYHICESLFSLL